MKIVKLKIENWEKGMNLIKSIMLAMLLLFQVAVGQKLKKHVIGAGGKTSISENYKLLGTYGQFAVGKPKSQNMQEGIGFWYGAIMPKSVTLIYIPDSAAWIGNEIEMPIIMKESKYWRWADVRNFEAKIRYNSTVLEPIFPTPDCVPVGIDECVLTITGTMDDTAGVLATLNFFVRLGSVEFTPLVIESFKWLESDRVEILTDDGSVDILGICKEGDTSRFVKQGIVAGLQQVNPNPASDYILLNYSIREKANTKIVLTNNLGREVALLFEGIAEPGRHSELVDIMDIASGLYYVTLVTPTQSFSLKLVVNK